MNKLKSLTLSLLVALLGGSTLFGEDSALKGSNIWEKIASVGRPLIAISSVDSGCHYALTDDGRLLFIYKGVNELGRMSVGPIKKAVLLNGLVYAIVSDGKCGRVFQAQQGWGCYLNVEDLSSPNDGSQLLDLSWDVFNYRLECVTEKSVYYLLPGISCKIWIKGMDIGKPGVRSASIINKVGFGGGLAYGFESDGKKINTMECITGGYKYRDVLLNASGTDYVNSMAVIPGKAYALSGDQLYSINTSTRKVEVIPSSRFAGMGNYKCMGADDAGWLWVALDNGVVKLDSKDRIADSYSLSEIGITSGGISYISMSKGILLVVDSKGNVFVKTSAKALNVEARPVTYGLSKSTYTTDFNKKEKVYRITIHGKDLSAHEIFHNGRNVWSYKVYPTKDGTRNTQLEKERIIYPNLGGAYKSGYEANDSVMSPRDICFEYVCPAEWGDKIYINVDQYVSKVSTAQTESDKIASASCLINPVSDPVTEFKDISNDLSTKLYIDGGPSVVIANGVCAIPVTISLTRKSSGEPYDLRHENYSGIVFGMKLNGDLHPAIIDGSLADIAKSGFAIMPAEYVEIDGKVRYGNTAKPNTPGKKYYLFISPSIAGCGSIELTAYIPQSNNSYTTTNCDSISTFTADQNIFSQELSTYDLTSCREPGTDIFKASIQFSLSGKSENKIKVSSISNNFRGYHTGYIDYALIDRGSKYFQDNDKFANEGISFFFPVGVSSQDYKERFKTDSIKEAFMLSTYLADEFSSDTGDISSQYDHWIDAPNCLTLHAVLFSNYGDLYTITKNNVNVNKAYNEQQNTNSKPDKGDMNVVVGNQSDLPIIMKGTFATNADRNIKKRGGVPGSGFWLPAGVDKNKSRFRFAIGCDTMVQEREGKPEIIVEGYGIDGRSIFKNWLTQSDGWAKAVTDHVNNPFERKYIPINMLYGWRHQPVSLSVQFRDWGVFYLPYQYVYKMDYTTISGKDDTIRNDYYNPRKKENCDQRYHVFGQNVEGTFHRDWDTIRDRKYPGVKSPWGGYDDKNLPYDYCISGEKR